MRLETFPYGIRIDHDGRKYDVQIPDFTAPKCGNCGELSLDETASAQIDSAFRRQAGLLTPAEIREGRQGLGLKQEDFAEQLGLAVATVSRWENGAQVQQRSLDKFMRAFFTLPELRSFLGPPCPAQPQDETVAVAGAAKVKKGEVMGKIGAKKSMLDKQVFKEIAKKAGRPIDKTSRDVKETSEN